MFESFPPNSSLLNDYRDEDGNPFLSWRVYLLPYLGHQQLFNEFELTEPWDSPHNLPLADKMPDIFRSIGDAKDTNTTRIVIPYGETAIFQNDATGTIGRSRLRDVLDGVANTLGLIEVGEDQNVIWSQPDEVNFDPADPLAFLGNITSSTIRATTLESSYDNLHHLPANIPADAFAAMISRGGGGSNTTNAFEYMPLDTLMRQYETPG